MKKQVCFSLGKAVALEDSLGRLAKLRAGADSAKIAMNKLRIAHYNDSVAVVHQIAATLDIHKAFVGEHQLSELYKDERDKARAGSTAWKIVTGLVTIFGAGYVAAHH